MKERLEIEKRLKKLSQVHKPGRWKPESYIGANESKFNFLNLKVPYIRQDLKTGYSFSNQSFEKQWSKWNKIWHSTQYFEVALSAAHFVNSRSIEELYSISPQLLKWQKRVDNWALSDELSNCYSRLLEYKRSEFLPQFTKWHQSKNPWEVRQSLVGLLFYSRFRTKVLSSGQILKFVRPHLSHQHYYVQKGVGWTLRECWNLYPKPTFEFLKKNAKEIPPVGWTAATEKLSKKDKDVLKKLRKGS